MPIEATVLARQKHNFQKRLLVYLLLLHFLCLSESIRPQIYKDIWHLSLTISSKNVRLDILANHIDENQLQVYFLY
ncbi:hypothetical protein D3C80_1862400 [compost metagenome]